MFIEWLFTKVVMLLIFIFYRLIEQAWTAELPPVPPSGVLDPVLIDPLGRTRLKKLKTRPWTPGDRKPQVCIRSRYLLTD